MNKQTAITLNQLDKTPIGEIITYPAKELFRIQKQVRQEFEKALMRKQWVEDVIQLKYKTTLNDLIKNAEEALKANQKELYNKANSSNAQDSSTKNQKPNQFNDDLFNLHNKHAEYIQDGKDCIKVEFYKGLSDIFQCPTIKTRFSLVNPATRVSNYSSNKSNQSNQNTGV